MHQDLGRGWEFGITTDHSSDSVNESSYSDAVFKLKLEELRRGLDSVKNSWDSLQSRATTVLVLTGTILTLAMGTSTAAVLAHAELGLPGVVALVLTMVISALTLNSAGPGVIDAATMFGPGPPPSSVRILEAYSAAFNFGYDNIARKTTFLTLSIVLLILGVVLLVASIAQGGVTFAGI